jgi:hypothetical protein
MRHPSERGREITMSLGIVTVFLHVALARLWGFSCRCAALGQGTVTCNVLASSELGPAWHCRLREATGEGAHRAPKTGTLGA